MPLKISNISRLLSQIGRGAECEIQGNACRIDWEIVCPKKEGNEIYILGNPPYLGYSLQSKEQKEDMTIAFDGLNNYRNLDYISCWFWIASLYMKEHHIEAAFVSTNSIIQGEQVPTLWPNIFLNNIEIGFAHQSFKWTNNAKGNAGVTCVIIGLRNKSKSVKTIFYESHSKSVSSISPYLTEGNENVVSKRSVPISDIPKILRGSGPVDGGHLIMSESEKIKLLSIYSNSLKLVTRL